MSITIVDHINGGKAFLDTETFIYYQLPEIKQAKKFISNDKETPYYDSFYEFIASDDTSAVIPVFCGGFKHHKKRTQVELHTFKDVLYFFNVERINNRWVKNDVEKCIGNNAYLSFAVKNIGAENDLIIRKIIPIKRNGRIKI